MNRNCFKKIICSLLPCIFLASGAYAQESAYNDINSCAKAKQIKYAATGAVAGALIGGLGGALLGGKNKGKAAAIGAAAGAALGGAAGWGYSYYTAVKACNEEHPEWIKASELEPFRDADYQQAKAQYARELEENGGVLKIESLDQKSSVVVSEEASPKAVVVVLTPDGAEQKVTIKHRLVQLTKDLSTGEIKEEKIKAALPNKGEEELTMPNGKYTFRPSSNWIPFSKETLPEDGYQHGLRYKLEVKMHVDGKKFADSKEVEFWLTNGKASKAKKSKKK